MGLNSLLYNLIIDNHKLLLNMKIYVEETSLSSSPTQLLHLAKDNKNVSKINKILVKLEPYLVKKNRINDIYSKEGIYQVNENQTHKLFIKSEKNNENLVLKTTDNKNITLVIDDCVIEKEPVYQIPYEHIIIPLITHTYSLNKKNAYGLTLVIEFIDNTNNTNNTNGIAKPINYYFEYNSKNDVNIPLEDINVFLSLLN
jgi:hypothetical protein